MALSSLFPLPARTTTAASNPLITEYGKTELHFLPPGSKFLMEARHRAGNSIHDPPYHWHQRQTETFHVKSGSARAIINSHESIIEAGGTFTIPVRAYHTFYNASTTLPLMIEIGLDPSERARDEAFFRNLYSYQDDCLKQGREPSVFQVLLFLWKFECVPALPGPGWVMRPLARGLVWLLGVVVGKWVFGLRENYVEYYRPAVE